MSKARLIAMLVTAFIGGFILSSHTQDIKRMGCDWTRIAGPTILGDVNKDSVNGRDPITGAVSRNGSAIVIAGPNKVVGTGHALDLSISDVMVTAVQEGIWSESWRDNSSQEGLIDFKEVTAEIEGLANLQRADCAAAALGYAQFTSNVSSAQEGTATLTISQGETVADKVGEVSAAYKGIGITLDIKGPAKGLGKYPDHSLANPQKHVCQDLFTYQHKVRGYIRCYADAGFFTNPASGAFATARLHGRVKSVVELKCCPPKNS
jgi:hypothetical protein